VLHVERAVAGLGQQLVVVLAVQQPDVDVGIQLLQQPQLAVLRRHQRLLHRRQLDVEVVLRKVEVGSEHLGDPRSLPGDRKGHRLV